MPLRAILFDKDGTLVDFNATWGVAIGRVMRLMTECHPEKLAALAQINHYDLSTHRVRATSPLIAGCSADYGPAWAAVLGEDANLAFFERMDRLCAEEVLRSLSPIGEACQIIKDLAGRGFILGMITNDSQASAKAQCDVLGLTPYLASVIGYDSGHGRKPEAGQILAFLNDHRLSPAETALVGDTLHDLDAARAAGVMGIAVLTGFATRSDLSAHADHMIASIDDLPALLDRIGDLRGQTC